MRLRRVELYLHSLLHGVVHRDNLTYYYYYYYCCSRIRADPAVTASRIMEAV
jgi:hypothetical protein